MKPAVHRAALRAVTFAAFVAASAVAQAADTTGVNRLGRPASDAAAASAVVAGSAVPSLGAGAVLQTLFGLVVVIGLVFGAAWLARRLGFQPAGRGGLLRVVSSASLGNKERVAVVEIGDTWLVVGIAPGSVQLLHTQPAGAGGSGNARDGEPAAPGPYDSHDSQRTPPGSFAARFRAALLSEAGKRFQRQTNEDR